MFRDMLSTTSGIKYTSSGDSLVPLSSINPTHDYRTRTSYTPQSCSGRSATVKWALARPFSSSAAHTNLLSRTLQGTLGKIIRLESKLASSYGDFGKEIYQWNKVLSQNQNASMVTRLVDLMQTNEEIHGLLAEEIEKLKNSFGGIYEREKKLMDKIAQSKKNLAHFEDLTKKIGRNAARTNLAYESLEEDAENIRVLENQLVVSLSKDLKEAILNYLVRLLVTSSQLNSMVLEYQTVLVESLSEPSPVIIRKQAQENNNSNNGSDKLNNNNNRNQHQNRYSDDSPVEKYSEAFQTPFPYSEREREREEAEKLEKASGQLPTPTSRHSEVNGINGVQYKGRGQRILSTFALYQPRESWA